MAPSRPFYLLAAGVGVFLASLLNWLGLALMAVAWTRVGQAVRPWGWWIAVGPLIVVLSAHSVLGRLNLLLLLSVLAVFVLAQVSQLPKQSVIVGGVAAILVLAIGSLLEYRIAHAALQEVTRGSVWSPASASLLLRQVETLSVAPGDPNNGRVFGREWLLGEVDGPFSLEADGRVRRGSETDFSWGVGVWMQGRRTLSEEQIQLGDDWTRFTLEIGSLVAPGAARMTLFIEVPPAHTLEFRNLRLVDGTGTLVRPPRFPYRPTLWIGNPNTIAHSLAALLLMVVVAGSHWWVSVLATALTIVGVAVTGTRTAVVALAIGLMGIIFARLRLKQGMWVAGGLVAVGGLFAWFVDPTALGRFGQWDPGQVNVVARLEYMRMAWEAMLAAPWTGLDLEQLAHNFWLQLGGTYGVPGFVAAWVFTGGLVVIAWRRGRLEGLALAGAVLALQVADDSLLYLGVTIPVFLAIHSLQLHPWAGEPVSSTKDGEAPGGRAP